MRYKDCGEECRASLYIMQQGRCAICGRKGALVVDHDHNTDEVRGLLCGNCNTGLGMLQDDEAVIARALAYVINTRPAWRAAETTEYSQGTNNGYVNGEYQKFLELVAVDPIATRAHLSKELGVSMSTISNYRRKLRATSSSQEEKEEEEEKQQFLDASNQLGV